MRAVRGVRYLKTGEDTTTPLVIMLVVVETTMNTS
jgi:hypothetical protein